MIKCQNCRDKDAELLTWTERVSNWLFYRVNQIFFPNDLEDYRQQKYTQGFSDGREDGIRSEKTSFERYNALYNAEKPKMTEDEVKIQLSNLLSPVDWNKVVTMNKQQGFVYIGGVQVEEGRLMSLKAEADYFANSELWALLYETPKDLAQKTIFTLSESLVDLQKGKSMLYCLGQQKNILELFRSVQQKK